MTKPNFPRIVWQGRDEIRKQDVRVVEDGDGWWIAERKAGHDAMGDPRWEAVLTSQGCAEFQALIPEGLAITVHPRDVRPVSEDLPYGLVMLPKGIVFRDLTRKNDEGIEERALLIMFCTDFEQDEVSTKAIEVALEGNRGKLVLDGHYAKGAFYVLNAAFYSEGRGPVVQGPCPMVVDALQRHLEDGDPEEEIALPERGSMTARRVLELLKQDDKQVLRFVQDIHDAALQMVRGRPRKGIPHR